MSHIRAYLSQMEWWTRLLGARFHMLIQMATQLLNSCQYALILEVSFHNYTPIVFRTRFGRK